MTMSLASTIKRLLLGMPKEELAQALLFETAKWSKVEFAVFCQSAGRPAMTEHMWIEKISKKGVKRRFCYVLRNQFPREQFSVEFILDETRTAALCEKLWGIARLKSSIRIYDGNSLNRLITVVDKRSGIFNIFEFFEVNPDLDAMVVAFHKAVYSTIESSSLCFKKFRDFAV